MRETTTTTTTMTAPRNRTLISENNDGGGLLLHKDEDDSGGSARHLSSSNGFKDAASRFRETSSASSSSSSSSAHYRAAAGGGGSGRYAGAKSSGRSGRYYIKSEKRYYGTINNGMESPSSYSGKLNGHSGNGLTGRREMERADGPRSPSPEAEAAEMATSAAAVAVVTIGNDVYSDRDFIEQHHQYHRNGKMADTVSESDRYHDEVDRSGAKSRISDSNMDEMKMETANNDTYTAKNSSSSSSNGYSRHTHGSPSSTSSYDQHHDHGQQSRDQSSSQAPKHHTWMTNPSLAVDSFYHPPFSAVLVYYPKFLNESDLLKIFEKYGTIEKMINFEKPDKDTVKILIKYSKSSAAIRAFEDLNAKLLDSNDCSGSSSSSSSELNNETQKSSRLKIRLLNQKFDFASGSDEFFSRDNYDKTCKLFIKIGIKVTTADLRTVFEKWGPLSKVQILYFPDRTSKGLAYITFQRGSDSARAKEECSSSFCPKFAFVQTSEETYSKFITETVAPTTTGRHNSPRRGENRPPPRKRSLSPASRRAAEPGSRAAKIRRAAEKSAAYDRSSSTRNQAAEKSKPQVLNKRQLSRAESSEKTANRPVSVSVSPKTTSPHSRTFQSDESKTLPPPPKTDASQALALEMSKPARLPVNNEIEATNKTEEPVISNKEVAKIPNVEPTSMPEVKTNGSREKKPPPTGEKGAAQVAQQLSKTTALRVKTKLNETMVTSLADLVPTLRGVDTVKKASEENGGLNVFVIKYGDHKMAEHAKLKLSSLDLGSNNGGKIEVEYFQKAVPTVQPRAVLKTSVSLIETSSSGQKTTVNELLKSSLSSSASSQDTKKTEIPKNSLAKPRDFSVASILGLGSSSPKIESAPGASTITSKPVEVATKTSPPPPAAATQSQPSKPVDPRLQKRAEQQATKPPADLNELLLKSCLTGGEPKKKITVVSIECERPTSREAMKSVLSQFNNLLDVMMNEIDSTKAYAFFENEYDAILAASMLNNKKMADNNRIKMVRTNAQDMRNSRPPAVEAAAVKNGTNTEQTTATSPLTLSSLNFLFNSTNSSPTMPLSPSLLSPSSTTAAAAAKTETTTTFPGKSYESLSTYLETITRVPTPFSYLVPPTPTSRSINLKEYLSRSNSLNF